MWYVNWPPARTNATCSTPTSRTTGCRSTIPGSSAKLLRSKIATELRGHGLPVEAFPFSFAESASAAGIALPETLPPGPKVRTRRKAHLDTYLNWGGFPEVREMALPERVQTLQDHVELVLLRAEGGISQDRPKCCPMGGSPGSGVLGSMRCASGPSALF
jgi:hypothetical protein